MKLFRYEQYKVTISEEAFALKPFKQIWNRDKSQSKDRAIVELGFIYFMKDPRSDYQYLVDEDERAKAIKEDEGLAEDWKPDKLVKEAMEFYDKFKPTSALLLEDTRFMIDKYRKRLRDMASSGFGELTVKELKEIGALVNAIPNLVKNLDEAEKTISSEMRSQGKMRGQGEKTIFEDSLTV